MEVVLIFYFFLLVEKPTLYSIVLQLLRMSFVSDGVDEKMLSGIMLKIVENFVFSLLLLGLQLLQLRAKTGFPRLIGYQNFINDLKKLIISQNLAHLQLRVCLKY